MTTETLLEAIRSDLVQQLDDEHVRRLRALAKEMDYRAGDIIFRQGDPSDDFHLLLSGRVLVEFIAGGRAMPMRALGPGEELGWSCFAAGSRRRFQARCLESSRTLRFDAAELERCFHADPSFGFAFLRRLLAVASNRLYITEMRLSEVMAAVQSKAASG